MMLRTLACASLALVLLAAACGDSNDPSSDTVLAFISDRDGNAELYTMNAAGGEVTRLTDTPEREHEPVWSPDGEKIAFWRISQDGSVEYVVMDADGANEVVVAETDIGLAPLNERSWSPDSSRLLVVLPVDGIPAVFVASADGSSLDHIDTDGEIAFPLWSPTSDRILLQLGVTNRRLVTALPDGSDPIEVTNDGRDPAWSPDGTMVAFVSGRDGSQQVYVTPADGGDEVLVSQGEMSAGTTGIFWSPDGTRFAFYSLHEETADLSVANADGSGLTALTTHGGTEVDMLITEIVWSPDGERIAFVAMPVDLSAAGDIFVITTDGEDIRNVTLSPLQAQTIIGWTHDSQHLLFAGEPPPGETTLEEAVNIYRIDADGSNLEALTESSARDQLGVIQPQRDEQDEE